MKVLGHLFMILFIIVVILGFYVGTELNRLGLSLSSPLRNMPLNTFDFNWGMALIVWFPGVFFLIAALIFYWMDLITGNLALMRSVLREIAGNTKQAVTLLGRMPEKESAQGDYSKPGDAPEYPRAKGESDSDYWERVSKRQHFADTPKQGDDPRFPRFRDELNYDYWERVKSATQNR